MSEDVGDTLGFTNVKEMRTTNSLVLRRLVSLYRVKEIRLFRQVTPFIS